MHYFNPDVLHARAAGTTANKDDKDKFANLLGPTDPKLDRYVREKLITARVGYLNTWLTLLIPVQRGVKFETKVQIPGDDDSLKGFRVEVI